jgi:hypothetical protein
MAASSGFRSSPGHAALGDAACIASTPPHGHQNGLRRRCIRSSPPPFLLGVIIAKDHVYGTFKLMPSYYINLIGVINVFVYYGPPPTTMDAVLATIVAGGRAQFQ